MITQTQYNALCRHVAGRHKPDETELNLAVADLLESFEVLHAILNGLCATGNRVVNYAAFEALYNDEGDQRVELVSRGRAPRPFPYVTSDRGWRAV